MEFWTKPIETEVEGSPTEEPDIIPDSMPVICPIKSRHLFSNMINNCLMHRLIHASSKSFEALEKLLIVLIKDHFLTIKSLNEQFVTILREEWPEVNLSFYALFRQLNNSSFTGVASAHVDAYIECSFKHNSDDVR